ncbi:MAG: hypothetical protein RLZZ15_4420 [Verrucomicrobiota bacterium]|jgi:redox-sensitive bicupin YhaK (pirin superfamily)
MRPLAKVQVPAARRAASRWIAPAVARPARPSVMPRVRDGLVLRLVAGKKAVPGRRSPDVARAR